MRTKPAHLADGRDVAELRPGEVEDVFEVVGDDVAVRVHGEAEAGRHDRQHDEPAARGSTPHRAQEASNDRVAKGKWPPLYSSAAATWRAASRRRARARVCLTAPLPLYLQQVSQPIRSHRPAHPRATRPRPSCWWSSSACSCRPARPWPSWSSTRGSGRGAVAADRSGRADTGGRPPAAGPPARPRATGCRCSRSPLSLLAMNFSFYEAISRAPVGIVVAVEFLGPLGVAVAGSRRLLDGLWVVLAAAGIALLAQPSGTVERGRPALRPAGRRLAGRRSSCRPSGRCGSVGSLRATMLMLVGSALVLTPIFLATGVKVAGHGRALLLGLAVAVLSSALPYSLELAAIKRVRPSTYGVLLSIEPAIAALWGFVILSQRLALRELFGIVAIVLAAAGAAWTSTADVPRPSRRDGAERTTRRGTGPMTGHAARRPLPDAAGRRRHGAPVDLPGLQLGGHEARAPVLRPLAVHRPPHRPGRGGSLHRARHPAPAAAAHAAAAHHAARPAADHRHDRPAHVGAPERRRRPGVGAGLHHALLGDDARLGLPGRAHHRPALAGRGLLARRAGAGARPGASGREPAEQAAGHRLRACPGRRAPSWSSGYGRAGRRTSST